MGISDTSPEAAEVQHEIFRRMTGERRLQLALELSDFARELSLSRIRSEHPDWSEWEVKRELLRISFLPDPLPAGLP
jgi:hypothetical protein